MRTEDQKRDDRFFDKANTSGPVPENRPDLGPCHLWVGYVNGNGYGHFYFGHTVPGHIKGNAHRFSYWRKHGDIPAGMDLDHLCRNRSCVNPDHLEAVPRKENLMRGLTAPAINAAKTRCPYGHEYANHNLIIKKDGGRACRICVNEAQKRKFKKTITNESKEQRASRLDKNKQAQRRWRENSQNAAHDRQRALEYRHAHLEEVRAKQRAGARARYLKRKGAGQNSGQPPETT